MAVSVLHVKFELQLEFALAQHELELEISSAEKLVWRSALLEIHLASLLVKELVDPDWPLLLVKSAQLTSLLVLVAAVKLELYSILVAHFALAVVYSQAEVYFLLVVHLCL